MYIALQKYSIPMKKIFLLVSIIITMSSCFYSGMDDDYSYIQPEIKLHVDSFLKEGEKRNVFVDTYSLKISFGKNKSGVAGLSYSINNSIIIDSTSFDWKNNPEQLIYHELGHLLLHRGHNNEYIDFKIASIMNAHELPRYQITMPPGIELYFSRSYYLDELFSH